MHFSHLHNALNNALWAFRIYTMHNIFEQHRWARPLQICTFVHKLLNSCCKWTCYIALPRLSVNCLGHYRNPKINTEIIKWATNQKDLLKTYKKVPLLEIDQNQGSQMLSDPFQATTKSLDPRSYLWNEILTESGSQVWDTGSKSRPCLKRSWLKTTTLHCSFEN